MSTTLPPEACGLRSRFVGSIRHFGLTIAIALAVSGCQPAVPQGIPIKGHVLYKGKPLVGGAVYYEPVDQAVGRIAMGRVGEDGEFTLRTSKGIDGVMPGEYRIRVEPSDGVWGDPRKAPPATREPPPMIPGKYLKASSSGLKDNVAEGHSGRFDIELVD